MTVTARREGYRLSQVVLHWSIAALVIFQLVFGESMAEVVEAAEEGGTAPPLDQSLASAHYWVGIAVLALVALRLALRIRLGVPGATGETPLLALAATTVHAVFYVLLVLVPVTGLLAYYVGDPWGDVHEIGKPVFIVLILLHTAGALFHQFWLRDGTLRRMLVPRRS